VRSFSEGKRDNLKSKRDIFPVSHALQVHSKETAKIVLGDCSFVRTCYDTNHPVQGEKVTGFLKISCRANPEKRTAWAA
jgi:hypothetical protein